MKTSTAIVVVVAIIVVGGAWYYYSSYQPAAPAAQTQTNPTDQGAAATPTAPMSATVTYGPNGFSPATVTIAPGGTVTFTAEAGASAMWVASALHPSHESYDGTSRTEHCAAGYAGATPFDQCKAGTSYSFTFYNAGTWKYHNHSNSSQFGTVIVQ